MSLPTKEEASEQVLDLLQQIEQSELLESTAAGRFFTAHANASSASDVFRLEETLVSQSKMAREQAELLLRQFQPESPKNSTPSFLDFTMFVRKSRLLRERVRRVGITFSSLKHVGLLREESIGRRVITERALGAVRELLDGLVAVAATLAETPAPTPTSSAASRNQRKAPPLTQEAQPPAHDTIKREALPAKVENGHAPCVNRHHDSSERSTSPSPHIQFDSRAREKSSGSSARRVDSLASIAAAHGVDVEVLQAANSHLCSDVNAPLPSDTPLRVPRRRGSGSVPGPTPITTHVLTQRRGFTGPQWTELLFRHVDEEPKWREKFASEVALLFGIPVEWVTAITPVKVHKEERRRQNKTEKNEEDDVIIEFEVRLPVSLRDEEVEKRLRQHEFTSMILLHKQVRSSMSCSKATLPGATVKEKVLGRSNEVHSTATASPVSSVPLALAGKDDPASHSTTASTITSTESSLRNTLGGDGEVDGDASPPPPAECEHTVVHHSDAENELGHPIHKLNTHVRIHGHTRRFTNVSSVYHDELETTKLALEALVTAESLARLPIQRDERHKRDLLAASAMQSINMFKRQRLRAMALNTEEPSVQVGKCRMESHVPNCEQQPNRDADDGEWVSTPPPPLSRSFAPPKSPSSPLLSPQLQQEQEPQHQLHALSLLTTPRRSEGRLSEDSRCSKTPLRSCVPLSNAQHAIRESSPQRNNHSLSMSPDEGMWLTTQHEKLLRGDAWDIVFATDAEELRHAFVSEVAALFELPEENVRDVRFELGSLITSFDLVHDRYLKESEINALLAVFDFPRVRSLYRQCVGTGCESTPGSRRGATEGPSLSVSPARPDPADFSIHLVDQSSLLTPLILPAKHSVDRELVDQVLLFGEDDGDATGRVTTMLWDGTATPDNEPITLAHLALLHDVSLEALMESNPQLSCFGASDALPTSATVVIPRAASQDEDTRRLLDGSEVRSSRSMTPLLASPTVTRLRTPREGEPSIGRGSAAPMTLRAVARRLNVSIQAIRHRNPHLDCFSDMEVLPRNCSINIHALLFGAEPASGFSSLRSSPCSPAITHREVPVLSVASNTLQPPHQLHSHPLMPHRRSFAPGIAALERSISVDEPTPNTAQPPPPQPLPCRSSTASVQRSTTRAPTEEARRTTETSETETTETTMHRLSIRERKSAALAGRETLILAMARSAAKFLLLRYFTIWQFTARGMQNKPQETPPTSRRAEAAHSKPKPTETKSKPTEAKPKPTETKPKPKVRAPPSLSQRRLSSSAPNGSASRRGSGSSFGAAATHGALTVQAVRSRAAAPNHGLPALQLDLLSPSATGTGPTTPATAPIPATPRDAARRRPSSVASRGASASSRARSDTSAADRGGRRGTRTPRVPGRGETGGDTPRERPGGVSARNPVLSPAAGAEKRGRPLQSIASTPLCRGQMRYVHRTK